MQALYSVKGEGTLIGNRLVLCTSQAIMNVRLRLTMLPNDFLARLQAHTTSFAKAVATDEGEWIIKGFIDVYRRIYTISVDTKITSKVLELLLFPLFVDFGKANGLRIELSPHQNFYPDLTFIDTNQAVNSRLTSRARTG